MSLKIVCEHSGIPVRTLRNLQLDSTSGLTGLWYSTRSNPCTAPEGSRKLRLPEVSVSLKILCVHSVGIPVRTLRNLQLDSTSELTGLWYSTRSNPCTAPEGSRKMMLPDFVTVGSRRWRGCATTWYSFLLGAESTPGPYCGRKDYVDEKFESNPRLSGL